MNHEDEEFEEGLTHKERMMGEFLLRRTEEEASQNFVNMLRRHKSKETFKDFDYYGERRLG